MKKLLLISFLFFTSAIFSRYPGRLIAIEGIDGAGKTCLLKELEEKFLKEKISVVCTREPGATKLGQKIRSLLVDDKGVKCPMAEYLLFAADRAQHFAEKIIPALKEGKIVISDRMSDSSLAYQSYVNGLNFEMIQKINAWTMSNTKIDLVVYLRITPEQAKKRILETRGQQTDFEQKYFDRMEQLFEAFEEIFAQRNNILVVDATKKIDEIVQQVFDAINGLS